jgi:major curlin subunit
MLRALALLLAIAPLEVRADIPAGSRAAEAILLGAERQAARTGVLLRQSGRDNAAAIGQSGTGNGAIVVQRGRGHLAIVTQEGEGNAAKVVQLGRGSSVVIEQTGSSSTSTVRVGR